MRLTRSRTIILYSSLTLITISSLAIARSTSKSSYTHASLNLPVRHNPQQPLIPPTMNSQNDPPSIASSSSPQLLSDTLSASRSLSLFSSLARDDSSTASAFSSKNSPYIIVLAPLNSAIKALDHRPWEDEGDVKAMGGEAYKGEQGRERAERNLRRWVQGCLVFGPPAGGEREWKEGEKRMRGVEEGEKKEVWWEARDGKQMIMPEGVEVESVVGRAANGEVWALKGTFGK